MRPMSREYHPCQILLLLVVVVAIKIMISPFTCDPSIILEMIMLLIMMMIIMKRRRSRKRMMPPTPTLHTRVPFIRDPLIGSKIDHQLAKHSPLLQIHPDPQQGSVKIHKIFKNQEQSLQKKESIDQNSPYFHLFLKTNHPEIKIISSAVRITQMQNMHQERINPPW